MIIKIIRTCRLWWKYVWVKIWEIGENHIKGSIFGEIFTPDDSCGVGSEDGTAKSGSTGGFDDFGKKIFRLAENFCP